MSRPAAGAPDGRQPARRGPDRIGSSGRWQVLTQTALYELDLDRCVACRHPGTAASRAAQVAPPEVASPRLPVYVGKGSPSAMVARSS